MNSTDLTNCDREQIHQITYVQGHGAFVAVTPLDMRIHHASDNVGEFFRQTENVHYYIGKKLHDLVSSDIVSEVQTMIRKGQTGNIKHSEFDIFVFNLRENVFGVEFERNDSIGEISVQPETLINSFIQKMHLSETLESLSHELCRSIRALTGMERVMLYRFFPPSMYGEVIAEDRVAEAHSFMGHRFPPTDIPKPARELYLKNQVRFIHDSHGKDAEVYPKTAGKNIPMDMSDSRLRGVSKIHIEYLKNMGVRSSLSFAIIVEGRLWGLVACHHQQPIPVSHTVRYLGEALASAYALGASMIEKIHFQQNELSFFNRLHDLFADVKQSENPLQQLFREGPKVMKLFNCSGMALVSSDKSEFFGITPLPNDLKEIHSKILEKMEKDNKKIFVTESLAQLDEKFTSTKDQASGVLAARVSDMNDKILILMRPEYIETIYWGGDPRKNLEARNYGGTINPRASFETWTEVVKFSSRSWMNYEVKGIDSFRNLIFDALINKDELFKELQSLRNK